MAKLKKEKVEKSVAVVETPSESVPAPEVKTANPLPETFLVRWKGGEEVFNTRGEADYAVSTRVGGYIV